MFLRLEKAELVQSDIVCFISVRIYYYQHIDCGDLLPVGMDCCFIRLYGYLVPIPIKTACPVQAQSNTSSLAVHGNPAVNSRCVSIQKGLFVFLLFSALLLLTFHNLWQCYQAERKWHEAESCYKKAFFRIPHKVIPLFLTMNVYKQTGEYKKMKDMARRIVKMRPKIKSKRFDNIQKEASQTLKYTMSEPE